MSDTPPNHDPGQAIETSAGPGRSRSIGPEGIGAVLAAMIVVAIVGGVVAGGLSAAAPSSPPSQAPTSLEPTAAATPVIDVVSIATCLAVDGRLEGDRLALEAELAATPFDTSNVAAIMRAINADVIIATDGAARLQRLPASAEAGTTLTTFYTALHRQVSGALDNSLQNGAAYRAAATATVQLLLQVPALDALLRALRDRTAVATDVPSAGPPSGTPGSPSPRPTRSPSRGPSSGPPPAPPSSSAGLVNPGFEDGVGPPWELLVSASGAAQIAADQAIHAGGAASARIDISAAGVERTAVAVRQGGLAIEAGQHVVATISVRAATTREVRVRIASATGDTYATRLFTVGPDWQVLTIDTTVFATDLNAYFEIDLGRFDSSTWLDDASFVRVAATGS